MARIITHGPRSAAREFQHSFARRLGLAITGLL